jgi:DNA polymerase-3 subunit epsilon
MSYSFHYDTETTGLPDWKVPSDNASQPHIVQLAALLVDNTTQETVASMNVIIKPDGWIIPKEVSDIHGITTEHALTVGIPEQAAVEMLLRLRGDHDRVAYNKTFDQRIIRIALKRFFSGETTDKWAIKDDHHCSMRLAREVIGGKQPKLIEAYKMLCGKDLVDAHTAIADAQASKEVYFAALGALSNKAA